MVRLDEDPSRAQIVLVGALAIAFIVLGIVVVFNTSLYAENVDSTGTVSSVNQAEQVRHAGGDSVAGSHHLRQNFMWRPFGDWQNYETPLADLYMVGAATWPGGGVNALSGYLAAQKLTAEETAVDQIREQAVSALTRLGTRL